MINTGIIDNKKQKGKKSPKEPLDVSEGIIPGCRFDDLNMSNSYFHNINLSGTKFDDINMKDVTFHNICMSDATFGAINLGGAKFIHIGPPSRFVKIKPLVSGGLLKCLLSMRCMPVLTLKDFNCWSMMS